MHIYIRLLLTMINLSPLLNYQVNDKVAVGVGPSYMYSRNQETKVVETTYGGRVYGRYQPKPRQPLFLQAELESLNAKNRFNVDIDTQKRQWYSTALIGGGINFPIMKSSSFNITVLRNLLWQNATPVQGSPWVFRVGFQL